MRRILLAAAAGIVLAASGWALVQAARNRSEPRGGSLELTERELGLEEVAAESTATVLRLNWDVLRTGDKEYGPAMLLDAAKLSELGFDCRLPLSQPGARRHYNSMPPRPVYLAMEYEGETWRKASTIRKVKTRLWAVDAALDPRRLRQQYPDPQHYIICRGLVRLGLRDRNAEDRNTPPDPRLEGWIAAVCPGEVFVPLPYSRVLRELRRRGSARPGASEASEPRYAVRICWGANYEPWVEGVRLLSPSAAGVK
jgi:hypothetical protein